MLKKVLRRIISTVVTLFLVVSILPFSFGERIDAATITDLSVSGLTVSYDAGTWTANGNSLSGSATGTAKGTCDDATSTTSTLTLKNTKGSSAQLSFDYTKPSLAKALHIQRS